MLSIRKVFTKNKRNKQQKKKQNSFVSAKSSSSSTSDDSASTPATSTPTTPTSGPFVHDTRGIFRTLEPIWYYGYYPEQQHHDGESMTGANMEQNQHEEQELDWVQFDPHCQTVLEFAYRQNKASCDLGQNCIVQFTSKNLAKTKNKNKSNTTVHRQEEHDNIAWVLDETVRRVITPVWWFEQDSVIDGSKGMCRFDYKNQARLEALADEDRTKLSLVDEAFPHPFTITLVPKSRDQKEEWRGFLHYEYPAIFVNNTTMGGSVHSHSFGGYDNNQTSMMMMMKPPTMDYFYDQIEPARRMSSFHFQQHQPIPIHSPMMTTTPLAVQDGSDDMYYYGNDDAITTSNRRFSI